MLQGWFALIYWLPFSLTSLILTTSHVFERRIKRMLSLLTYVTWKHLQKHISSYAQLVVTFADPESQRIFSLSSLYSFIFLRCAKTLKLLMNFGRPLCGHSLVFHYFILYSQCLKCQNLCYYHSYLFLRKYGNIGFSSFTYTVW